MSAENRKRAEDVWDSIGAEEYYKKSGVKVIAAALTAAEERGRREGVEQMRDAAKRERILKCSFDEIAARLLSEGGTDDR